MDFSVPNEVFSAVELDGRKLLWMRAFRLALAIDQGRYWDPDGECQDADCQEFPSRSNSIILPHNSSNVPSKESNDLRIPKSRPPPAPGKQQASFDFFNANQGRTCDIVFQQTPAAATSTVGNIDKVKQVPWCKKSQKSSSGLGLPMYGGGTTAL